MTPHQPNRVLRVLAFAAVFACVALFVAPMCGRRSLDSHAPRSSPNHHFSAVVRDPSMSFIDRNLSIEVTDTLAGTTKQVFRSYDQSPLIKTERLAWSSDSRYVAVIGDRYFVTEGSTFPNGEILFLVYDVENDTVFCNADDDDRFSRMSAADAAAVLRN